METTDRKPTHQQIAELAYHNWQQRLSLWVPGDIDVDALGDWILAERELTNPEGE